MKVTLIMPAVGQKHGESYVDSWKMEPLSMAVLAGLTPDDVEVSFYDDSLESIPYDEKTDLIAINVETYTARRSYYIAQRFRERGIPVVLGGYHPTLAFNDALECADAIVIGEAENVWCQILEDAKRKTLKKIYQSHQRSLLSGAKAKRSIFQNKRYTPLALIESGRGCSFSCSFCSIASFFRQVYSYRPAAEVVKEIEVIAKKEIFFVDDNITADFKRAKELFRELIPLKIRWISQGSINMTTDHELLSLMKKSGCLGLLIGLESLDKSNLIQMKKSWNAGCYEYEMALRKFREVGIAVYGTFIFGYDGDSKDSIVRTLDFAVRQKLFLAAFNHLTPFPGTLLYKELQDEGRLLHDKWWISKDYRFGEVVFRPKNIEPDELAKQCLKARNEFYGISSVLKRATNFEGNCNSLSMFARYFALNLFSLEEVNKRQGLPLGDGLDAGDKK